VTAICGVRYCSNSRHRLAGRPRPLWAKNRLTHRTIIGAKTFVVASPLIIQPSCPDDPNAKSTALRVDGCGGFQNL
jgi:hypothetical protein